MKDLSWLESYSSVNMTHFEHYFLEFARRFSRILPFSWGCISKTRRDLSKSLEVDSIWVVSRTQTQERVRCSYLDGRTWSAKSVSFDFLKFWKSANFAKFKFEFRANALIFADHLYGVGKPLIRTTYICKDIYWILIHFSKYAIKVAS